MALGSVDELPTNFAIVAMLDIQIPEGQEDGLGSKLRPDPVKPVVVQSEKPIQNECQRHKGQ